MKFVSIATKTLVASHSDPLLTLILHTDSDPDPGSDPLHLILTLHTGYDPLLPFVILQSDSDPSHRLQIPFPWALGSEPA